MSFFGVFQNCHSFPCRASTPLAQFPERIEDAIVKWVETPEQLQDVVDKLRSTKRVALDLEHNSQRSYLGVTCLLQLSTGKLRHYPRIWALFNSNPLERVLGKIGGLLVIGQCQSPGYTQDV